MLTVPEFTAKEIKVLVPAFHLGVSKNRNTLQIIHFNRVFHCIYYKPSILGVFPLFLVQLPFSRDSHPPKQLETSHVNSAGKNLMDTLDVYYLAQGYQKYQG